MKFGIKDFMKNLSKQSEFPEIRVKTSETFMKATVRCIVAGNNKSP